MGYSQIPEQGVLQFDDFMEVVKLHHPVAKRANLILENGEAGLLRSRGGFDPRLFSELSQKNFDDSQYYSLLNSGFNIPTWYGVELNAGYELNRGNYLDPENTTPESGLVYAGISIPVGKGLMMDRRRAELEKAKTYLKISEADRQLMLNDLFYQAGLAYWNWYKAYNKMTIFQEAYNVTVNRLDAVKAGFQLGDRPAIDTLEAGLQVQSRLLSLQESQLEYENSRLLVSTFLWIDGTLPIEPDEKTTPGMYNEIDPLLLEEEILSQMDNYIDNHPDLQKYYFRIQQLEIDKRWKSEQLKPTLDFKYNAITRQIDRNPFSSYNLNDYTWGFQFNMPLFLRKERGDLRLTNLEIQDAQIGMLPRRAEMKYKVVSALNSVRTAQDQILLFNQSVLDSQKLLEAERQMFETGESNLFMINSREITTINNRIKLVEIQTKNQIAILKTKFELGILNQIL